MNNIPAHNFSKISLLSAYNCLYKFDIICLSETYLDHSIIPQDPNLEMQGYTLTREEHPSNVKRGGVCVCYKNHLHLQLLNINYLKECVTFELSIKNKFCIIAALYRSPSQSHSEFTNFTTSLELTLQAIVSKNPFLSLVLDDFNAKNKVWFDQDNTTTEGTIINDLMTQYGLTQIIHESTHLLDGSSSIIDLIFTSQNNLATNSRVRSSLHSNCHHQISFFSKFDLKIHYPPPYERLVWEYDKANKDPITKVIDAFDWDKKLSDKYVND